MPGEDSDTGIKIYLPEIGRIRLVTPQEEIDLTARIKKGDRNSESLRTGLLCNQYNPECDGKSAIRIRAKVRGYLKQKTIVNL